MSVPASSRNRHTCDSTRWTTIQGDGHLYSGSSITKGGVSPGSTVFLRIHAIGTETTAPRMYIRNRVSPCRGIQPKR